MKQQRIQRFDLGMGVIDAHLIKETDSNLEDVRQEYVEVYPAGISDPSKMVAWFGSVESFARWISGAEIKTF